MAENYGISSTKTSHYKKGGIMKLPSDYKRNYKFRTDTSKEKKYINAILFIMVALVVLWYVYKYFFT